MGYLNFKRFKKGEVKVSFDDEEIQAYENDIKNFNEKCRAEEHDLWIYNKIQEHLSLCGRWFSFNFYCKKCDEENKLNLLSVKRVQAFCGIRYCDHADCITNRYSRVYTQLQNIERLHGLRKMLHFVIGFEKIDIKDFDKERENFERVIHTYFRKLKEQGLNIQAFKVLDISKGKRGGIWDGKYFVHYHFGAIPFKFDNMNYALMQNVRAEMLQNQKVKVPFHVQVLGNKTKESLFSYISLRAVGLYKTFEFKKDVEFKPKKLREQIENGEFMLLKDMFNIKEYMRLFFGRRFFSVIGGMPYGSKVRDNVSGFIPESCPLHGELARCDVRLVILPEGVPEPPPNRVVEVLVVPVCVSEVSWGLS